MPLCQTHEPEEVTVLEGITLSRGKGRGPVQYFFVDGKWQASDANVAYQPFLLQLHQLRNGLLYYLKIQHLATHTEACVWSVSHNSNNVIMMLYKAAIQRVMCVL